MLTSRDRILTTHCGSLPRPPQLSDMLLRQEAGERINEKLLHRECQSAVAAVLDAQIKAGLDIVSDGEQPRVGFSMYLPLRMEGFGGEAIRPTPRDLDDFPIFMERLRQNRGRRNRIANPPKTIGEVRYTGLLAAKAEYDLFKSALGALRQKPNETFMTAPSPGIIATTMVNEYYDSYETYVFALARELRKEYELIASYGFLLQLDAPDFGLERARMFKNQSDAEFLHAMELNVEAINRAPAFAVVAGNDPHRLDAARAQRVGVTLERPELPVVGREDQQHVTFPAQLVQVLPAAVRRLEFEVGRDRRRRVELEGEFDGQLHQRVMR